MSSTPRVFGVKITLDDIAAPLGSGDDSTIGFIKGTVGVSNSRFQWLQSEVTGLSGWCASILTEKGLGSQSRSADWSKGGNVSNPVSFKITLKNVAKFHDKLATLGTSLVGALVEKYEFTTNYDTTITQTRRLSAKVESCSYDSGGFYINVKGGRNDRNVNLTSQQSVLQGDGISYQDVAVPVIWGATVKTTAAITSTSQAYKAEHFGLTSGVFTDEEKQNDQFQVVSYSTVPGYPYLIVKLTDSDVKLDITSFSLIGKYVAISSGNCSGQVRRITDWNGVNDKEIGLKLAGWLTATPTANDWLKLYDGLPAITTETFASLGPTGALYTWSDPYFVLLRNINYSDRKSVV
jgi:hypothetical protein